MNDWLNKKTEIAYRVLKYVQQKTDLLHKTGNSILRLKIVLNILYSNTTFNFCHTSSFEQP